MQTDWSATKKSMHTRHFVVGESYSCTSICDSGCRWTFTIAKRTEKSVWLKNEDGKIKRRKISIDGYGVEHVHPLGIYSMSPTLRAA